MKDLKLPALGWNAFFESQLNEIALRDFRPGRVIHENKTNYGVRTGDGECIAGITGKLMYGAGSDADLPKVGDWVITTMMDEGRALIHQVLRRKTVLSRKAVGKRTAEQVLVANLDVLFVVQGLDDNFSMARLERYLTAIDGIEPVIVLNKADLRPDLDEVIGAVRSRIPGVPVIATSTVHGMTDALSSCIRPMQTFAFAGSSGVGKSSLINSLLKADQLKTSALREKDSKGRHTTTRREMIFLESGGILVDTPGMREFQPWAATENASVPFADILALSSRCRFADCRHIHEGDCAVKEGVQSGSISPQHYENYLKLRREMDYQLSLVDRNIALQRKRLAKQQIKSYKRFVRDRKGRGD